VAVADLNYLFSTLYGFEPFNPVNTGAKVTGQNLVVTAWTVVNKGGDPFIEVGQLLQPSTENDNLTQARRVGSSQAVDSRCSAQFFFEPSGVKPIPLANGLLFLALNPPPELRQQCAQAVVFNGGDPTDIASYTVKKSLMGGYTWRLAAEEEDSSQNFLVTPSDMLAIWGTYLDLGDLSGAPDNSFPLLKTSGADGTQPQFFDRSTAQGVQEMIAAVNAGNFFVPMLIAADFSDSIRITLTYPHSNARA
jgi:hypothetical protein